MDKIIALCKRRGFIYPSSEIYGGISGFWDYGPLGVELKNNIKRQWWKRMVEERDDVVGIDAAIIMNPKVWEASGHVKAFTDPLVECKLCHQRFRADRSEEISLHEKDTHSGKSVEWTKPKRFNLLVETYLGTVDKTKAYLRGEVTQGVFVNFKNVIDSTRVKIPFGISQIGKAFRNEITPGNYTFRSREFEQMELEFFIENSQKEAEHWFEYWKNERLKWYTDLGMNTKHLRLREHEIGEKAHYAKRAEDIEYEAPFGWSEFEGIHDRGDWDLSQHSLTYKDLESGKEYTPSVIETSGGVDRSALFFIIDAYREDQERILLSLNPRLAPYKVAVFPLLANKKDLVDCAEKIYHNVKRRWMSSWDDRGNIGKRYASQDEIGTPFCITVDFETLKNDTVTVRDRDTTKQERVAISKLEDYLSVKLN